MNGTNLQRVMRVAGNLVQHPELIVSYFKRLPVTHKEPIDYELPWYSYASIDYLDRYITKEMVVFEYGGGGSTLFYARRAKQVVCVESNQWWADRLQTALEVRQVRNVTLLRHLFDASSAAAFCESDYLNCVSGIAADIYVIDGYEESIQLRPYCFAKVEKQVRQGNIIVVDDSWRYETIRQNNEALKRTVFQSVGPCRYGVTSTDVFFY